MYKIVIEEVDVGDFFFDYYSRQFVADGHTYVLGWVGDDRAMLRVSDSAAVRDTVLMDTYVSAVAHDGTQFVGVASEQTAWDSYRYDVYVSTSGSAWSFVTSFTRTGLTGFDAGSVRSFGGEIIVHLNNRFFARSTDLVSWTFFSLPVGYTIALAGEFAAEYGGVLYIQASAPAGGDCVFAYAPGGAPSLIGAVPASPASASPSVFFNRLWAANYVFDGVSWAPAAGAVSHPAVQLDSGVVIWFNPYDYAPFEANDTFSLCASSYGASPSEPAAGRPIPEDASPARFALAESAALSFFFRDGQPAGCLRITAAPTNWFGADSPSGHYPFSLSFDRYRGKWVKLSWQLPDYDVTYITESTDGVTFTPVSLTGDLLDEPYPDFYPNSVASTPDGLVIIADASGALYRMVGSDTVRLPPLPFEVGERPVLAYGGDRLVVVGNAGIAYSDDCGGTWALAPVALNESDYAHLTFSGGRFVAALSTGVLLHSVDGAEWIAADVRDEFFSPSGIAFATGVWVVTALVTGTYDSAFYVFDGVSVARKQLTADALAPWDLPNYWYGAVTWGDKAVFPTSSGVLTTRDGEHFEFEPVDVGFTFEVLASSGSRVLVAGVDNQSYDSYDWAGGPAYRVALSPPAETQPDFWSGFINSEEL